MNSANGLKVFDLTGKVAVVTGGTGVLGSAIAAGFGRAGAKVAVAGRRRHLAETLVEKIKKSGGEALPLIADVLDLVSLREARNELQQPDS
jgi:NAD(P)-dependent dehydrogenase (short-subunit alcohol dehydrogenase family)